jgi:HlyD family secretion protein
MLKPLFLKIVSVLFVLTFVASCAPGGAGRATPTPLPPVVSYEKSIFTVKRGPIVEEKRLVGEIVPSRQEEMFFRTSGYVTRVPVKQGDVIKEGTVLAEMQIDDLMNQLQQAQIDLEVAQENQAKDAAQRKFDLEKAKADVVVAQRRFELAKIDTLRAGGLDREKAQLNQDIAEQNLNLAEEALKLMEEDSNPYADQAVKRSQLSVDRLQGLLAERQIVAPYDCIVLRSSVRPGQQVEAFSVSFVVGDPTDLVIRSPLDYDLSKLMDKSTEVSLTLNADDTESHPVDFLPNFLPVRSQENKDLVQRSSSNDYIFFSLPKDIPQADLTVGRSVYLDVILGRKDNVLLLPPSAIREYKGLMFVIVQDGDKRRRVEINKVGLKTTDQVEIEADLQEGDQVQGP